MARNSAREEQLGENVDNVERIELPLDADRKRLVRELIDDIEHAVFPSLVRAIFDEVVAPHVIAMFGPKPHARTVGEPQTPAFRLLIRNLEPLAPPDPLDPLVVDDPARITQKRGYLAIAIAPVLTREFDGIGGQPFLVLAPLGHLALCRAMLAEHRTGAALGDLQRVTNMIDALAPARRA